jgi:hypothetical protein
MKTRERRSQPIEGNEIEKIAQLIKLEHALMKQPIEGPRASITAVGPVTFAPFRRFLSFQVASVGQLVCRLHARVSQNRTTLVTHSPAMS